MRYHVLATDYDGTRAQNLMFFLQIGDGVDDETWQYHLRQGDVSRCFRECIKDENLASAAERLESLTNATPQESRALIRVVVEQDYTVPASLPLPVIGFRVDFPQGAI